MEMRLGGKKVLTHVPEQGSIIERESKIAASQTACDQRMPMDTQRKEIHMASPHPRIPASPPATDGIISIPADCHRVRVNHDVPHTVFDCLKSSGG